MVMVRYYFLITASPFQGEFRRITHKQMQVKQPASTRYSEVDLGPHLLALSVGAVFLYLLAATAPTPSGNEVYLQGGSFPFTAAPLFWLATLAHYVCVAVPAIALVFVTSFACTARAPLTSPSSEPPEGTS